MGFSAKGSLQVDLAVGTGITGDVSHHYRLYHVVNQSADKVCAT